MVCLADGAKLTKATRVYEGAETDRYECENGHTFGMGWNEPATEPQWPPGPEYKDVGKPGN